MHLLFVPYFWFIWLPTQHIENREFHWTRHWYDVFITVTAAKVETRAAVLILSVFCFTVVQIACLKNKCGYLSASIDAHVITFSRLALWLKDSIPRTPSACPPPTRCT